MRTLAAVRKAPSAARLLRGTRGFTLAEVLIATAFIMVAFGSVGIGFLRGTSSVETGRQQTTAIYLAEQRLDLLEALFSEIDRGRLLPARLDRARAPKKPDAHRPERDHDEGGRDQDLGEREAPRAAEQTRGARSFSDGGQSSHDSEESSAENVPTPPGVRRPGFSIGSR